jgi:hypothetical protein
MKIARVADLNDPFELLAANLGGNKQLRKAMRDWRNELNKTTGLLCFSRDWYSPVLWSHYADKHRGICLGFELNDKHAEPVDYVEERLIMRGDRLAFDESVVRKLLKTKYVHWSYEREVRVFVRLDPATAERGLYFSEFSNDLRLTEVIMGPLCEISIERVRHLVGSMYPDAQVLRARLAFKSFNVVPRESTLVRPYVSPVDASVVKPNVA